MVKQTIVENYVMNLQKKMRESKLFIKVMVAYQMQETLQLNKLMVNI